MAAGRRRLRQSVKADKGVCNPASKCLQRSIVQCLHIIDSTLLCNSARPYGDIPTAYSVHACQAEIQMSLAGLVMRLVTFSDTPSCEAATWRI